MVKTFVAINDWSQKLLREIARRTPLIVERDEAVHYALRPELLPEAYYCLAACHTLDGLPLEQVGAGCWRIRPGCKGAVLRTTGGLEATQMDRRCWRDLRLRSPDSGLGLMAGELLVFGTGTLRRTGAPGPDGKIHSNLERVFSRIWALGTELDAAEGEVTKQVFESSNVIYGDVFGELEQIWERRADTHFLDAVARDLDRFRPWRSLSLSVHPPRNAAAVFELHLRAQALWRTPPRNGRGLLKRIEFILENTILDSSAVTLRGPAPIRRPKWR